MPDITHAAGAGAKVLTFHFVFTIPGNVVESSLSVGDGLKRAGHVRPEIFLLGRINFVPFEGHAFTVPVSQQPAVVRIWQFV